MASTSPVSPVDGLGRDRFGLGDKAGDFCLKRILDLDLMIDAGLPLSDTLSADRDLSKANLSENGGEDLDLNPAQVSSM